MVRGNYPPLARDGNLPFQPIHRQQQYYKRKQNKNQAFFRREKNFFADFSLVAPFPALFFKPSGLWHISTPPGVFIGENNSTTGGRGAAKSTASPACRGVKNAPDPVCTTYCGTIVKKRMRGTMPLIDPAKGNRAARRKYEKTLYRLCILCDNHFVRINKGASRRCVINPAKAGGGYG